MGEVNGLLELLIYVLVGGLLIYVVFWILGMLNLPQQVKTIVTVIISIIILLWLLLTFVPGLSLGG